MVGKTLDQVNAFTAVLAIVVLSPVRLLREKKQKKEYFNTMFMT